jgi:glutamate-1-semialdehyde aminotransferase
MMTQIPTAAEKVSQGWKFYEKAKKLIPGGTQLLSKRPENFLPGNWPCYYTRAKGCEIWDLEDRKFIDMTTTGIGACLLGYADDEVNDAVKSCIDRGNLTTLNVPAEVELAQRLIDIHPWAKNVRYARSGGESMMVAVRIARAFTRKSAIALCGYHGWGDWYLAANLGEDSKLDGHLLPGLQPNGVPGELRNTVKTFRYNQIDELQSIVDEITSGWRHNFGGSHLLLGTHPDIAVFAKSLSNGFPMGAVIGTEEVMQASQESFISSTFWTEAMGPTAALATLAKMSRVDVSSHVKTIGTHVQKGWKTLAATHGLDISVIGLPAICTFSLNYEAHQSAAIKTLLTQELLDRGFLGNTTFYPTLAHDEKIVSQYLAALDESFAVLAKAIREGTVLQQLRGAVVASGFARLT